MFLYYLLFHSQNFKWHILFIFSKFIITLGRASHWRAQCHRGGGICACFDGSTWSNQSRKFSTFSATDWLKPWSSHCWSYRRTKTSVCIKIDLELQLIVFDYMKFVKSLLTKIFERLRNFGFEITEINQVSSFWNWWKNNCLIIISDNLLLICKIH